MRAIEEKNKSFDELLKVGICYGYSPSRRHPKMKPFISSSKNNVEIFDPAKIKVQLEAAKEFLKKLGSENKMVVFVGTKKEVKGLVGKFASSLNMPYVTERWLGGILTNFKEIKGRLDHLGDLVQKRDSGELEKYTKKERLQIGKEIIKMERFFKSLQGVAARPASLVVIDSDYEKNAVDEAKAVGVPIVALMNSDCNPEGINFPVPGSDSSLSSVEYFLTEITKAYKEGASNAERVAKDKETNTKNDNSGTN